MYVISEKSATILEFDAPSFARRIGPSEQASATKPLPSEDETENNLHLYGSTQYRVPQSIIEWLQIPEYVLFQN